ncbi:hypothetical protein Tco_0926482 [Tanacetum coccineum]|uniref:BZIP domain-containing protein n=1 Tax=Tanacetum coccineum TaxID=301880 RepID=A0ABQ5DBX1_9ASTR
MSDSEDSTVTYTAVSSPFEDGSDIGSPGVDGPPIMPEDPYAYIMAAYQVPPSPDYIPGPEEPQSPPPLDFVPEPMYPEYMPQEDEILPAEEQPLPAAASPTADSPGYVPESDPEEEPEEDDEDPEEDPADYPADRDDDDDDDEDEDEDEEEEEEHPASADSVPPRLLLTAPTPRVEVGESSAAAARQPGSTMAHRVDQSFIDTADVRRRKSLGFYSRHQEAQEDRAAVRTEIEILRRERLSYEQERIEVRQALARSEAYSRALEAWIRVLETQAYRHE